MTRKHFELIAKVISQLVSDGALALDNEIDCRRLSEMFAEELKKTNPLFNEERFFKACGTPISFESLELDN